MAKNKKITQEEKLNEFLKEFNKDLAKAINEDIIDLLSQTALSIKGPLVENPVIQINVSKNGDKLIAFLREKNDQELSKTYLEIDLLATNYPKNSLIKKELDKFKKQLSKINKK